LLNLARKGSPGINAPPPILVFSSHLHKFQFIDAANRRKFTITNDKLQMNGMDFAHDFNYFRRKYLNL